MKLNISLEDVETFIAVAEAGSFSLAASRLNVSQPTATARIKRLEESFGVPLFTRTTRRVQTTAAGDRLREHSEALLIQLNRLREEFRGETSLSCGTLALGATPALAAVTLPPLVAAFSKAYPGISIRIHDEHRRQAFSDLSSGVVDLAIIGECQESREFDFEPLFAIDFYVICPQDHELSKSQVVQYEDLARYPLLTMPLDESIWSVVAAEFAKRGLAFRCSFEATGMFTVLQMVEVGLGLTILPSIALSVLNPARHVAISLAGRGELTRKVGLARLRGREFTPSAKMFRQCARKWVREQLEWSGGLYRPLAIRSSTDGRNAGDPKYLDVVTIVHQHC